MQPPIRAELHVPKVQDRPDPILQQRLNEGNGHTGLHNGHVRPEFGRYFTDAVRCVIATVDAVRSPAIAGISASSHSRQHAIPNVSPVEMTIQLAKHRDVVAALDETDRQLVRRPLRAAHALRQIRLRRREQESHYRPRRRLTAAFNRSGSRKTASTRRDHGRS